MTLERSRFDKVDKVMLTGGPRVTRVAGQASRDADGMVRQDFDVSTRDVTTVPIQHDGEPDQHRRKVHGGSGPDVMPAPMCKELFVSQGRPKEAGRRKRPSYQDVSSCGNTVKMSGNVSPRVQQSV